MNVLKKSIKILMAEDDEDDYLLAAKALYEARLLNEVHRVKDGEELMDYLLSHGTYQDRQVYPLPLLILLDLNLPKKDGREALKEIKAHPELSKIPVVVLTTSKSEEDVAKTYDLGVSSFIRKPVTFQGLVDIMKTLKHYWLDIVTLPPQE
ncbi:MAG TPA: response regulator [Candidatus Omnitrophota bacterium]|nr:response regulator [Candidatus Omnitrophota bacterium]HPS37508.1 response regulator [Candidatus Omnitrophota bacterium]